MTLRPPRQFRPGFAPETGATVLDAEILAEQASSLGRAGENAEHALARLSAAPPDAPDRPERVMAAARAVHGYFIQRELMGFRKHGDVIEALGISREVLAKVGVW